MNKELTETLSVVVERDVPHAQEKVWRALTQPQLIEEWLMKNDFAPVANRRFSFNADWGSVDCQVLQVDPIETLAYTWAAYGLETVVTWTLKSTPAGTNIRMEQSGFRPEHKQAYNGAKAAWPQFFTALEKVVDRLD